MLRGSQTGARRAATTVKSSRKRHWRNTFHIVGLDERGAIMLRHKGSRGRLPRRKPLLRCSGPRIAWSILARRARHGRGQAELF
jgi:hypothetical protein